MHEANATKPPAGTLSGCAGDGEPRQIINIKPGGIPLERIIDRGEEVFNGISAVATLLKIANIDRLRETDQDGFLESVGYLVEMLAAETFKTNNELRFLQVSN